MATIYPNRKDGKIISVKLKAYLGRDEQIVFNFSRCVVLPYGMGWF